LGGLESSFHGESGMRGAVRIRERPSMTRGF
jgi:hypothetical protein